MPKIYEVGGCVRDRLLGLKSKDIDYTFVLDDLTVTVDEGFEVMVKWLVDNGFTIFLSTPECYTVRAKFPNNHKNSKLTADFVMARKEIGYEYNSRRPILTLGTLEDDLFRRDFTVNAMALDEEGNLIDLFGGQEDLLNKILRTPNSPKITLMDDPLRLVRALRFSVTKNFDISKEIYKCFEDQEFRNDFLIKIKTTVSPERFREELFKMFKEDTIMSIYLIQHFKKETKVNWFEILLGNNNIWLKPTTEK